MLTGNSTSVRKITESYLLTRYLAGPTVIFCPYQLDKTISMVYFTDQEGENKKS